MTAVYRLTNMRVIRGPKELAEVVEVEMPILRSIRSIRVAELVSVTFSLAMFYH